MTSTNSKPRAMAWDPRCPSTLLLPSVGEAKESFRMDTFMSHDGVGCNQQERSALMEVLDAYEAYLQSDIGSNESLLSLSKAYRKALRDCVQGWESEIAGSESEMQDGKLPSGQENLELLKLAYAVMHLSETFLLFPSGDNVMDYYENTSNLPGAVTAETVRYFRLHHMVEASDFIEEDVVEELFDSIQPDQLDGGDIYWKLLERYLVRGCLEDAWALLSRHSICRYCSEARTETLDPYNAARIEEDREGFEALRAILLSAPLPGGRTDAYDSSIDTGNDLNEDDGNEYIEGILPSAYRLWESSNMSRGSGGDYPATFNHNLAYQVYQAWKQSVNGISALKKLSRKIPQLQGVLSILLGDFSGVTFESWAEEFCAELLYNIPNLKLIDMHKRAFRVMEKFEMKVPGGFEEVVLSVMKGNGGRVVEVMHDLGGGSGAALPAVMTSLLCNLLDDARILPALPEAYNLKTELLLNAAFAIQSSLATEGHNDLAARLTVRFLLPHVKIKSDPSITAALVNTLQHHSPKTDAEANSLIALCRKLVERKNTRVLDGCVGIVLSRYRHFLRDQRPGGAVHWLLVGMELESLVLCEGSKRSMIWQRALASGVCYRLLLQYCLEISQGLLKGLLGDEEGVSLLYGKAKETMTALEESDLVSFIRSTKVLGHLVIIAEAIVEKKEESIIASSIVSCLEEKANDDDNGVVSSLARCSMHWDLLRLAKGILDKDARGGMQENEDYRAIFDVHGMQVLLERFTIISSSQEMKGFDMSSQECHEIRLTLGDGLKRAFVAENSLKKAYSKKAPRLSITGIYSADLGQYSREKQELVAASMVDF